MGIALVMTSDEYKYDMKKRIILLLLLLIWGWDGQAIEEGKIIVQGMIEDALIIKTIGVGVSKEARDFRYISNPGDKDLHEFIFPKAKLGQRFFVSCNKSFTLVELNEGETVRILLKDGAMGVQGDNITINRYLNEWVQKTIMKPQNALKISYLCEHIEYRANLFPQNVIGSLSNIEYLDGLDQLNHELLRKSGIKDKKFLEKQQVLIKYQMIHMDLANYLYMMKSGQDIPDAYKKKIQTYKLNDPDIQRYEAYRTVVGNYIMIQEGLLNLEYNMFDELVKKAECIDNQELLEDYVFYNLESRLRGKRYFMIDSIAQRCTPLLVSKEAQVRMDSLLPEIEKIAKAENRYGEKAYPFEYQDEKGELVSLSDYLGQYLFVDIWATWCGPCKSELPFVKKMAEEFKDLNIAFVSISVDNPKDKQKWLTFIKNNTMTGKTLIARNAFRDPMILHYGIKGIPRFMLIDPQGNIVSAYCGRPSMKLFKDYVKQLVIAY